MHPRRILPGFYSSLGFAGAYLAILIVVPLVAVGVVAASLSPSQFLAAVGSPRALAAYRVTLESGLEAGLISAVIGTLIAWVLVRYDFPGKRLMDALVDIPFALPTAVAGLVFSTLYAPHGWLGQFLLPLGINLSYTRGAIVLVMVFIGFPFVVRTLQPVLETLDADIEDAAGLLGASRWQIFRRIILPPIIPGIIAGFAMAFARCLGEYGSIVFVSSNVPGTSEIAAVLVVSKLEEFQYAEATAVASMMLAASFLLLLLINVAERRSRRWDV